MVKEECIVIGMAARNNSSTIVQAVNSALEQIDLKRNLIVIISDDESTDGTIEAIRSHFSEDRRVIVFQNRFGSAYKNRNWIQEYVKANLSGCVLLGRLDADDTIAESGMLSQIERLWEQNPFDVLLMANHQLQGGVPTGHVNRPESNLTDPSVWLERVRRMAAGEWISELPSCNVFVRPDVALPYPEIESAEDHWNLVDYLLHDDELEVVVKPDWVYCNYSIDNYSAADRKRNEVRSQARSALYRYALDKFQEQTRKREALDILKGQWPSEYTYLGAGFSGVVFHDGTWVYKVHLPLATNNFNEVDNILFLKEKLRLFNGRQHFFPLRELTEVKGRYVLVYPFEVGEKVDSLDRNDMLSFLAEMWQMKVICRSITKGNNFIRVKGVIKLIDYEIEPYDDNLFLNVAARAFIQLDDVPLEGVNYNKLKRSTINNFSLNELQGFYPYVEDLFRRIAHTDMNPIDLSPTLDVACEDEVVSYPDVTLLIKTCPQDSRSLYNDVRTKVSALTQAVRFAERVLLLDCYREQDFLRQYTEKGSIAELTEEANRLLMDGVIDRIMLPPNEVEAIRACNEMSFGFSSDKTHTANGVPVTAQMHAFQSVETRFVLQMDVDVLIGNKVMGHDYLVTAIAQLKRHERAVSVGFQIYHDSRLKFQEYTGFDGGIPPDVRCSLIDTQRLIICVSSPEFGFRPRLGIELVSVFGKTPKRNGIVLIARRGHFHLLRPHPELP
jgi:glycosyltransferase involved in cell wall biosynthesis